MMNKALSIVFLVFFFVSGACAEETVKPFTFRTTDGKTIQYRPTSGTPMVINIGAHW